MARLTCASSADSLRRHRRTPLLRFHKQMTEIGSAAESDKPLAKLCGDVLTTMASPPGRTYEKHKLTITPADQFTDAAKAAGKIFNP